jgi:hypothetical protein
MTKRAGDGWESVLACGGGEGAWMEIAERCQTIQTSPKRAAEEAVLPAIGECRRKSSWARAKT